MRMNRKALVFAGIFLAIALAFSSVFLHRGIKPFSEWSGESWSESRWWYSNIRIFSRFSSEPQHDLSYLGSNWGGFCGFICDLSLVCLKTMIFNIRISPTISVDSLNQFFLSYCKITLRPCSRPWSISKVSATRFQFHAWKMLWSLFLLPKFRCRDSKQEFLHFAHI